MTLLRQKSTADTNTNTTVQKYCQYQYQYFSANTFSVITGSALSATVSTVQFTISLNIFVRNAEKSLYHGKKTIVQQQR